MDKKQGRDTAEVISLAAHCGGRGAQWADPRDTLKKALSQYKLGAALRRIRIAWPSIATISVSLAENVTEMIPAPGCVDADSGSLLALCLNEGLRAGDRMLRRLGSAQSPEVFRTTIACLFANVAHVAQWRVTDGHGERWDVFRDGALHRWRLGRPSVTVEPCDDRVRENPGIARAVRTAIALRVLSTQDVDILGGELDALFRQTCQG